MGDSEIEQATKDAMAIIGMRKKNGVDPESVSRNILEQNMRSVGGQTNAFSELYNLGRVTAPAAIQMGATAAGAGLGAMTSPVTGPVGPVAGAMAGSGAGEAINQGLGLSDPSMTNIGVATALPGATAIGGLATEKALKLAAKIAPGSAATMHQIARSALERLGTIFGPTHSADELYGVVNSMDPKIPLGTFKAVTQSLLKKEDIAGAGLKLPGVTSTASDLAERVTPTTSRVPTGILDAKGNPIMKTETTGSDAMSFQDIRVNLRRIGDKIRETRITGGEEHGAWKSMRKALMDDLESAAATGNEAMPAVQALKQANAAARREFTQEEINDIITKGGMTSRNDLGEGFMQVNLQRIAEALRKGPHADDIRQTLRPDEYKMLTGKIADLAQATPNLPPPRGQFAGSAVRVGQIAGGGATGYLASTFFGLDPQTGAAVGTLAGAKGADWIARLLMTEGGRRNLQFILQSSPGGIISPQTMGLIGAAASMSPKVREGATNLTDHAAGVIGASQ